MQSAAATPDAVIARCPIFAGLDPGYRDLLADAATLRHLPAQTLLFRQGDPCPGIYVLASGSIRVFALAPNGKQHLLRMIDAPNHFLEVAVIGGFACPSCAETAEATSLVLIPHATVRNLLETVHPFCLQLLSGLAQRVRSLVFLLEDIVLRDATARIAGHLLERADRLTGSVTLATSRKDLASHLNLTPETFSRSMRQLIQLGVIAQGEGSIKVGDWDHLERAASGSCDRL